MLSLQTVFSNREIAIGFWAILLIVILIISKPGRIFIKDSAPILFCKKFNIFYILFLCFFSFTVYILYLLNFWHINLLKSTIFWVAFVEIPLFYKAILKAQNNSFFVKLIKDNITLIVIIQFILEFWSFKLITELIIVPLAILGGGLYALTEKKEKCKPIKQFLEFLAICFVIFVIIYSVKKVTQNPCELFNINNIKEFILPILLLLLNLPVVYALALYNGYEQIYIYLKCSKKENRKMIIRLIIFTHLNLEKVFLIRNNYVNEIINCNTYEDLKNLIKKFI